jgi:hypothetical protein
MTFSTRILFIACAALIASCGRETKPNPNYQAGSSGDGGTTGGSGGSGGRDAGGDGGDSGGSGGSGGTGGMTGGTGGTTGGSGGTTGGSGGDAGSTDCDSDEECPATSPKCDDGECAPCTSSGSCEDREATPFCQATTGSPRVGECVACLEDDHCEDNDDGPYCNNNACVPCKTNSDCTDLSKPQCGDDGQCTGCTDSEACEGRAGTEICRTDAGPNRGHCVACVNHSDCTTTDAPQCKPNNTCDACTSEIACADRAGTEHCNLRAGADTFGKCVECTGATEEADCGGNSCKQSTGQCTETPRGTRTPCQSCEADTECQGNRKCVKHTLGATDIGYFCFSVQTAAGCASETNLDAQPYSVALQDTLSIDATEPNQQATYCLPPKSCEAVRAAVQNVDCEEGGVYNPSICGIASMNEGQCPMAGTGAGTCTYFCASPSECPDNKPSCTNNLCSP